MAAYSRRFLTVVFWAPFVFVIGVWVCIVLAFFDWRWLIPAAFCYFAWRMIGWAVVAWLGRHWPKETA